MSIQNAERMLRLMTSDADLRARVCAAGPDNFEAVTREVGASCTGYEIAYAVSKLMESDDSLKGKFDRKIPIWEA